MSLGTFNRSRTLLLICDVQERFRTAIYGFDEMTNSIVKILKAAQILGLSTLTTEQNPRALGTTIPEIAQLTRGDSHLGTFSKTKFSMFTDEVQDKLKSGPKYGDYIIMGIESHVCVLQTALALLSDPINNGHVHIVADAVSSCNRQEIPVALRRIERAGGVIVTSESLLFQLMGDAQDPTFKPISAIVKEEKGDTARALRTLVDPHISTASP